MTPITAIEIRHFFPAAKKIKEEVVNSIKQKVNTLDIEKIEKKEDSYINRLAIRLCSQAFAILKRKIYNTYFDPKYANVISIFMSKQASYFIAPYFLQEELQKLILQRIQSTSS